MRVGLAVVEVSVTVEVVGQLLGFILRHEAHVRRVEDFAAVGFLLSRL